MRRAFRLFCEIMGMKPDLLEQQAHRAIQNASGLMSSAIWELLQQALTHRSYYAQHNGGFEFVGDPI